jgi:hypothetical protein
MTGWPRSKWSSETRLGWKALRQTGGRWQCRRNVAASRPGDTNQSERKDIEGRGAASSVEDAEVFPSRYHCSMAATLPRTDGTWGWHR